MMKQNSWPTASQIHCPITLSPLLPRKTILQTQAVVKGASPGLMASSDICLHEPWASTWPLCTLVSLSRRDDNRMGLIDAAVGFKIMDILRTALDKEAPREYELILMNIILWENLGVSSHTALHTHTPPHVVPGPFFHKSPPIFSEEFPP